MAQPVLKCKNGFSLVELMFAMVIILVSMLALLTSITTSINTNMSSEIRNAAVKVTNETAEAILALPIDDAELSDGSHGNTFTSGATGQQGKGFPNPVQKIRGYEKTYTITWFVIPSSSNLKQVDILVSYTHKGKSYENASLIYKHRAI